MGTMASHVQVDSPVALCPHGPIGGGRGGLSRDQGYCHLQLRHSPWAVATSPAEPAQKTHAPILSLQTVVAQGGSSVYAAGGTGR